MKKALILLSVLLLTGCSGKLVCTLKTIEENYETEQKITFSLEDDKVTGATVNYIMSFETEEAAKAYTTVFNTIDNDYEIELDGKKIQISSTKNYEQYSENKDKLKEELEKDGYSCK